MMETKPSVAVLIPCYNEELTIEKVVRDFRAALPDATVYVYDNNCRDRTAEIAKKAGAIVRREPKQGKGNVVTTMDADRAVGSGNHSCRCIWNQSLWDSFRPGTLNILLHPCRRLKNPLS